MTVQDEATERVSDSNPSSAENKTFRDRSHVIDVSGKRVWIYPRIPSGPLHRRRVIVTIILLLFFVVMPFLRIEGHPVFLFDFLNRRFILFGMAFCTQDFFILALAFLGLVVFIVLFTAVYGRIFCGWLCPQTIFLEMIFRKIECMIEGDGIVQKKFHQAHFTINKIIRLSIKHFLFLVISLLTSTVLSFWIIGNERVFEIYRTGLSSHLFYLLSLLAFAGVFYFIFARFRENVCIFVCPYGRLQSVLIDRRTLVVAYDFVRGEKRAPLGQRKQGNNYGDCVDCYLCKQVCPTGIDIRNGIQLECINCTACIDACNHVMEKIHRPKGLIRYASLEQIADRRPFRFSPRAILYSVVLLLLIVLVGYLIATRPDVEVTLLRTPGSLAQPLPDGRIANMYTAKIINKTFREIPVSFAVDEENGTLFFPGREMLILPPQGITETSFLIYLPPSVPSQPRRKIRVRVMSGERILESVTTQFMELNPGFPKK